MTRLDSVVLILTASESLAGDVIIAYTIFVPNQEIVIMVKSSLYAIYFKVEKPINMMKN